MKLTPEQNLIIAEFQNGSGNCTVDSRAGSSKTFTSVRGLDVAPEQNCLFGVFNKRNQIEMESKVCNPNVTSATFHATGLGCIKDFWGRRILANNYVEWERAKKVAGDSTPGPVLAQLCNLVGFLKNTFISPSLQDAQNTQLDRSIEVWGELECFNEKFPKWALDILELSKVNTGKISFNDMVWLPVAMNFVRPKYQLVVADECQDLNLPQLEMTTRISSGRVIIVGDDRQAIYGFRGAVQNALELFGTRLNAKRLTLTTSFRCPKRVIECAQQFVPDIKWADGAEDGVVQNISNETMEKTVKPGDAILCRTNAPLMNQCLRLLQRNVPAHIEGKQIGKDLIKVVEGLKAETITDFDDKLDQWKTNQLVRAGVGKPNARLNQSKIEYAEDTHETLRVISENCDCVPDVITKIEDIFTDSDTGQRRECVTLSTIHKAKGLEWNNVNILRTPARRGELSESEKREEENIQYVGITRARKVLNFVPLPERERVE